MAINLFPARVPIGRVVDSNGKERDVLMTVEFSRALSDLLQRVGGPTGLGSDDLALLSAFGDSPVSGDDTGPLLANAAESSLAASVAGLRSEVQSLRQEIAMSQSGAAMVNQASDLLTQLCMVEEPGAAVRYLASTKQANIVKGTATGSRAANAALASLLTALAASGLVIDSTTI